MFSPTENDSLHAKKKKTRPQQSLNIYRLFVFLKSKSLWTINTFPWEFNAMINTNRKDKTYGKQNVLCISRDGGKVHLWEGRVKEWGKWLKVTKKKKSQVRSNHFNNSTPRGSKLLRSSSQKLCFTYTAFQNYFTFLKKRFLWKIHHPISSGWWNTEYVYIYIYMANWTAHVL